MEGFANSGKRNKSDHKTAERDLLEEEAWQRDIANVANALSPLMVFTFMWAGAYEQSPFTPPCSQPAGRPEARVAPF